ncbi:MAG TPA: NAD(P)H-dependent glycerol-3-phosphate dehydrogenase [Patescibacteria group bacterium]|nr:NAD(P)H-dependent glycerol-3-phosphate dehydrogenase [Patescibacteria group bacterium]
MTRAAVLGSGSWGTALAVHLARGGVATRLWSRQPETAAALQAARENATYLPGVVLPPELEVVADLAVAIHDAELVLFVAPAQATRDLARRAAAHLPAQAKLVVAAKGIEETTGLLLTGVLASELGSSAGARLAVLSGPSFALEVARGNPTAVVVASADAATARRVQEVMSSGNLRLYRNGDPGGVALAGALKNVVAIATGIAEGLGLGLNTRAALITRGLAEITRLGLATGARASTFAGLAGAGDLVLTCTGGLSRNRALGVEIGRGRKLEEVIAGWRMVAEGVATTRAALVLASRHGVELPIASQVNEVLFGGRPATDAVRELLARPLKEEE